LVAATVGYRGKAFITMWAEGRSLPPLARLPQLANAFDVPLEDVLLPWLADYDPQHAERYKVIAAQLMGLEVAEDLFSGARENAQRPWWGRPRHSLSSAEVVSAMKAPPPGSYRHG
jgi:transcriptional regulator with XRE-family HTH domain